MIGSVLLEALKYVVSQAFVGIDALSLPLSLLQAVGTFTGVGVWLVGADLIAVFCQCVLFWVAVKFSIGLVLFIWRLLPLT